MSAGDEAAEARRLARAGWMMRVFRQGEDEAQAEADALFWSSIPIRQRAEVTWKLSQELFELAFPGSAHERRLPRSDFRPVRR
ncbi:hypothetical protein [Sorangium sp. So ce363]|uniref:hypothetical protein n=1 Tax=Sorangium sp. So ce363 TaxID=3133304 RepID=UPI003F5F2815